LFRRDRSGKAKKTAPDRQTTAPRSTYHHTRSL